MNSISTNASLKVKRSPKAKRVRSFTISRSTWIRKGKNGNLGHSDESVLMNSSGCKCCLGFFMLSRGAEEKDIVDESDPACGDKLRSLAPSWLVTSEGHLTAEGGELITINDMKSFSRERDRERAIKRVFAKHGIKVNFVD